MRRDAIMAMFDYEDEFLKGAAALKSAGFSDLTLMSPIPVHGVEEAIGARPNRVRYFSLAGAILGAVSGMALTVFTAVVFILPTGGRPLIPLPPYMVITYEMTILFGVLATLLGFHVVSGLPAWRDAPYTPEINVDQFAIVVPLDVGPGRQDAERIVRDAGAREIRDLEDTA